MTRRAETAQRLRATPKARPTGHASQQKALPWESLAIRKQLQGSGKTLPESFVIRQSWTLLDNQVSLDQDLDRADQLLLTPVRPGRRLNNGLNLIQERIRFGNRRRA